MSEDKKIDFFIELAQKTGGAVATVSDGHIILIKKDMLKQILDKHPDNEMVTIFVKKPNFKN